MTKQQKKAKSSIERLRLQEDPESKVGMLPDMQDLASPLAAYPNHVVDTNSVVANEGQPPDCRLLPTLPPEVAKDRRPIVKRLWQLLTDPDRPRDSASLDHRVGLITYLQRIILTGFSRTMGLRGHVVRDRGGHGGNGREEVLA